jgi:hypothetical protein
VQQATVNLFADMGIQPANLQPGLVPATPSQDKTPPVSKITAPANRSDLTRDVMEVLGTALDEGGGVVAAVEVSVDGGQTWHPANGRDTWSYQWRVSPDTADNVNLLSRAVDDSGNLEIPGPGITATPYHVLTKR